MKNLQTSSIRTQKNNRRLILCLLLFLFLSVLLNLCFGAAIVAPASIFRVLIGTERGTMASNVILLARLPRTVGCILAGMALATSGVILQSVLINPMASPSVIGVNAGAGFFVALSGAVFTTMSPAKTSVFAFFGALTAVLFVLFIAEKTGASRMTLILAGMAVSSIFNAGTDAVITLVPDALIGYTSFRIGGLENLSMAKLYPAAGLIGISLAVLFSMAGELDILALGTDTAESLGMHVKAVRLLFLILAAALAGAAVSFAGSIGFLGLIVPHIIRRFAGTESRILLPASALGGAIFLSVCDLLARLLFAPFELPVGIVLAFLGGPFFLWLLFRQKGGRTHD